MKIFQTRTCASQPLYGKGIWIHPLNIPFFAENNDARVIRNDVYFFEFHLSCKRNGRFLRDANILYLRNSVGLPFSTILVLLSSPYFSAISIPSRRTTSRILCLSLKSVSKSAILHKSLDRGMVKITQLHLPCIDLISSSQSDGNALSFQIFFLAKQLLFFE